MSFCMANAPIRCAYPQVGSSKTLITASKEVILSAGAINTPQILLNSGIGDAGELESLNIPSLVHLPDVGKNLSVHMGAGVTYLVNSTATYDEILRNATFREELVHSWNETHTGPLSGSITNFQGFFRLPGDSPVFKKFADPSAGPNSPHIQVYIQASLS